MIIPEALLVEARGPPAFKPWSQGVIRCIITWPRRDSGTIPIVPDTGQILDIQGIKLIQRPPVGKARFHANQYRAFVSLFERDRNNRQYEVDGLSGLVLPRPAQPRAKNVPAFAGYRNQSSVAAMSDIAAVLAAGLVPIRQERHIVHIDH